MNYICYDVNYKCYVIVTYVDILLLLVSCG